MCFGLQRMDVANEVGIGDLVVLGDLGLPFLIKYCAGAFDLFGSGASCIEAMGEESTPFICKGAFPDCCIGTEEELGKKGALFAGRGWSSGEGGDMMSIPLIDGTLG